MIPRRVSTFTARYSPARCIHRVTTSLSPHCGTSKRAKIDHCPFGRGTTEIEWTWYSSTMILNNFVDTCNGILGGSKSATTRDSSSRLHDRIKFIVYDMTAEDGVKGMTRFKLDLVSGLDIESDEGVIWSPRILS